MKKKSLVTGTGAWVYPDAPRLLIMTQKNFMSARALNMGELENVNGGIRVKGGTPKKETFGIRVK